MKVVETKLPDFPYEPVTDTVILAEAASIFEPLIRSAKIDDLADKAQIAGLKASLGISAVDYLKAMRIRALIKTEFHKLFSDIDILLSPTRYGPASKLGDPLDQGIVGRPVPTAPGMNSLIQAGNLVGLSRPVAAVRLRRQSSGGDPTGRPALLGEYAGRDRQAVPEQNGLASPPPESVNLLASAFCHGEAMVAQASACEAD